MATKMSITNKELNDVAFAAGVLIATTEVFLEGKMIDSDGMKMLKRANEIIEEYGVSHEELGIYVEFLQEEEAAKSKNTDKQLQKRIKNMVTSLLKAGVH